MEPANRPRKGTLNFCNKALFLTFVFRIQEAADKWGFVAQSLGLVWQDPSKQASS